MPDKVDWEDEIEFWADQLGGEGQYSQDVLQRFDTSKRHWEYHESIHAHLAGISEKHGRRGRILDVGSGPISIFAHGHANGDFDVVAADPLAHQYNRLVRQFGLDYAGLAVKVAGERLADIFPDNYFDIIWSFNSIDHTQNPAAVFRAMARVLVPGGTLMIQCWEKEATQANWSGLHQHDFTRDDDGGMRVTRKDGSSFTLTDPRLKPVDPDRFPLNSYPQSEEREWLKFAFEKE